MYQQFKLDDSLWVKCFVLGAVLALEEFIFSTPHPLPNQKSWDKKTLSIMVLTSQLKSLKVLAIIL